MADVNETENAVDTQEEVTTEANKEETITKKADPAPSAPVNESHVEARTETANKGDSLIDINKMAILNDVFIQLTIEIGRANIKIRDLLNLTKGSIIELDKLAGEPVNIYANGKLISMGNIITANGKYCVRLVSINENMPGGSSNGK